MRSPDGRASAVITAQLAKEWRELTSSPAFWSMLLLLSYLAGYSFLQAVQLYGEASRGAARSSELAAGLSPFDGIWVPTFGALYLATTFLFPFLGLRLIGGEKQTGSLKLQLQMPVGPMTVLAVKGCVLMAGWLAACSPFLFTILVWASWGGHLFLPEVATLLLGHFLYAASIGGIAFAMAAMADSAVTAAVGTLTLVMASFVLDFAVGAAQASWGPLATLSLTSSIRVFERGVLDLHVSLRQFVLAAALLVLTSVWLPPGRRRVRKAMLSLGIGAVLIGLWGFLTTLPAAARDVTEDRRNSFNPADERALHAMTHALLITMYLSPGDSRLQEFEANVLARLRRLVPHLRASYADAGTAGAYGSASDDRYGTIVYEYDGSRDESRSTSPEEVLSILHDLARAHVVPEPIPAYPGYPLSKGDGGAARLLFYAILPALVAAAWRLERLRPARLRRRHRHEGDRHDGAS